ncbi:inovirus Gp2 family protein [Comamonas humi]
MRFDLYVPDHASAAALCSNAVISKFFASLRAKIAHAQNLSKAAGHRVHDADVRHMWCREISGNGRVHYHVALLLNHAAYAFIGQFDLERCNMYARIHEAWATALHMHVEDMLGYVHVPATPTYQVVRDDEASFNTAFYRVSYFSKLGTKEYQQGFHTFGCSRS